MKNVLKIAAEWIETPKATGREIPTALTTDDYESAPRARAEAQLEVERQLQRLTAVTEVNRMDRAALKAELKRRRDQAAHFGYDIVTSTRGERTFIHAVRHAGSVAKETSLKRRG